MRIWTNIGTTEILLCDHGRGGPSNFVPQVVRKKDILVFVQADFAKPKARGNAYRIWSFVARIEHDTITAAQAYLLTLHQSTPEQADVWIELDDQLTQYQLPDCVIEFSPVSPVGVLTSVSWTLTFGGMIPYGTPTQLGDVLGIELNDSEGNPLTLDDAITGDPE